MSAPSPSDASREDDARPPVIVVTGPTGAGKTDLAIGLAQRFDGEIVNADSMQVFRFMDIGTAKPSAEERLRVPHHLFDVADPDEDYSAGRFAKEARATAEAIHGLLANGTIEAGDLSGVKIGPGSRARADAGGKACC